MAQTINRLTARKVETIKTPGYLKDGGGLFLQVGESGSKSWIFEFRFAGRRREMGLGSLERVSLSEARAQRDACNQMLRAHRANTVDAMSMRRLLEKMGYGERASVHGFRSTFRDWAAERTATPREVCEQALAHTIGNAVEAAYRRGDLFDKRRRLMDAWAEYCSQPPVKRAGKVVPMRSA